jgi:hypothetical protein
MLYNVNNDYFIQINTKNINYQEQKIGLILHIYNIDKNMLK